MVVYYFSWRPLHDVFEGFLSCWWTKLHDSTLHEVKFHCQMSSRSLVCSSPSVAVHCLPRSGSIDDLVICEYSNSWSDVVSSSPTWTASKVYFKSKDCITLQTFNCKLFVLFSIRFTLNQVNFIISDNIV